MSMKNLITKGLWVEYKPEADGECLLDSVSRCIRQSTARFHEEFTKHGYSLPELSFED